MNQSTPPRLRLPRLPQMPIAGQLMVLLVGVLVVAQGATLILTLAFPPQPPVQHSLEDIARTLGGEQIEAEGARPLVRRLSDAAPQPEGPGWISATEPRERLAGLLGADPDDVVLMFYLPLPAGAQPMAPPTPPSSHATIHAPGQPTPAPAPAPEAQPESPAEPAPPPAALPAQEPAVVAAAFAPNGTSPLLIRARYSPGDQAPPFAGRPAGALGAGAFQGVRPGGFPAARNRIRSGQGAARPGAQGLAARTAQARPWSSAERDFSRAKAAAGSAGSAGRPFAGEAWPRPAVQPAPGGETPGQAVGGQIPTRPPVLSERAKALVGAFADRRRVMASTGVMMSASVGASLSLASGATSTKTVAAAPPPVATVQPTVATPRLVTPQASPSSAPAAPAPTASATPVQAPDETSSTPSADRAADTAVLAPAVATPAPRRGLFAPTPAGYIEGDFVAARRLGDRWVVVEPRPEGFPTAWQSRVMLWFLLSFALVAPLGWLFARRITAPLRSFADAAERLGRDPSASATVQGGSAEIGRAAAAFNQMQARLKRYVDDRTAMIGAISHDLRTPLTRMRFRLEAAPERMKPGFETDIDQMEAMISSVLAFMRDQAEGGSRQRLDLRALLKEAVDNAVAGGANVAIEPGEAVEVDADAVALNRVFANLLDNAVKYGDRAVVRLAREGDDVVAAVHDFGPGLPDSELERVFKPFYRTPGAAASEAPGIGLGLANSRAIVLAHGGTIRLKSDGGLTAEVRLPIAA